MACGPRSRALQSGSNLPGSVATIRIVIGPTDSGNRIISFILYSAMPELKNNFIIKKKNVIAVFVFSDRGVKMLADLCPCFHRSLTKLCPDLDSFMCWIATEFTL